MSLFLKCSQLHKVLIELISLVEDVFNIYNYFVCRKFLKLTRIDSLKTRLGNNKLVSFIYFIK